MKGFLWLLLSCLLLSGVAKTGQCQQSAYRIIIPYEFNKGPELDSCIDMLNERWWTGIDPGKDSTDKRIVTGRFDYKMAVKISYDLWAEANIISNLAYCVDGLEFEFKPDYGYRESKNGFKVFNDLTTGDFNGDGTLEKVLINKPFLEESPFKVIFPVSVVKTIDYSDSYAQDIYVVNEGDLNQDGTDELSICFWNEGVWGRRDLYTFKRNKWLKISSTTMLFGGKAVDRVRPHPSKKGYVEVVQDEDHSKQVVLEFKIPD